jgi:hypothetical protein
MQSLRVPIAGPSLLIVRTAQIVTLFAYWRILGVSSI